MSKTPRTPRRARAILAAVATLFALMPATAAFAGPGYTDSGGDSGTGGTGGPGGGGGGTCIYTTAANGHRVGAGALSNGVRNTEWGDLRCNNGVTPGSRYKYGSEDPATTGVYAFCVSGYEVYRFYGTQGNGNKARAMTVSRINPTDWCQAENTYYFPQLTPYDRGPVPGRPVGAPWNVDQPDSPNGQIFGEALGHVSRAESKYSNTAGQLLLTTAKPFRWTSGAGGTAGCAAVQSTPDPVEAFFANPKVSEGDKQALRNGLVDLYTATAWINGREAFPRAGLAVVNSRAVSGDNDPNVPDQIAYNDGVQCSSLFDFAAVRYQKLVSEPLGGGTYKRFFQITPVRTEDVRWVGTCYIPLTRQARQVRFRSGATDWIFPTLQYGGGERYSAFYAFNRPAGAPNAERRDAKYVSTTLTKETEDEWREAMRADYTRRYNEARAAAADNRPGGRGLKMNGAAVAGDANQPVLPAQPYGQVGNAFNPATASPVARGENYNPVQAANVLADYARCRHTPQLEVVLPDPDRPNCDDEPELCGDPGEPNPTQTITMKTIDALQVGGTRTETVLGATVGPFTCPMGPGVLNCRMEQMSYNYQIKAPAGYNICEGPASSSVPRECDAMVIEGKKAGIYTRSTGDIKVRLYRATPAGKPLQLLVSGQQGTFYYETQDVVSGVCFNNTSDLAGGGSSCAKIVITPHPNNPYTPGVVGSPRRLDAPGVKRVPVIGANNS